jgi:Icc protein
MSAETVYFIQISDTHFGPTPGFSLHGAVALPTAQRLVDRINQMPFKPDFIVHTGDVTDEPLPASYALAAETLSRLRLPVYYVRGNHDSASGIREYMAMGPKTDLGSSEDHLTYRFETKGYRFLVLDTHGPPGSDPQGFVTEEQMALLREEAVVDGPPLVVFLHHPVLAMDSPWMDANMLIMNGEAVHQTLLPARDRLRGVFSGHIHQSVQTWRDGILYVAAGSSLLQLSSWPSDEHVWHLEDEPPAFNFVRLMPQQTMVRQHRFPRP